MVIKLRKQINSRKIHHPIVDMENLSVKRKNSGSDLLQLESSYKTTTIGLKKYLDLTIDWMLELVNTREVKKNIQYVKKAINLLNNSTSYRKKLT